MADAIFQTVGTAIKEVFPSGTNLPSYVREMLGEEETKEPRSKWTLPPTLQTDLFAVSAYLCKIGGVVGFFNPDPYNSSSEHGEFTFGRQYRDELDDAAWQWRGGRRGGHYKHPDRDKMCDPSFEPPEAVKRHWDCLIKSWDKPVQCGHYVNTDGDPECPDWWISALSLMIISDLAVIRPFRDQLRQFTGNPPPMLEFLQGLFEEVDREIGEVASRIENPNDPTRVATAPRGPATLCMMANSTVVCVMPKLRIAAVGTTIRNASRNLALLPGRGEMRCCCDMTDTEPLREDAGTLDLLIIPAPFHLKTKDFQALPMDGHESEDLHEDKPNWESFTIRQNWIEGREKEREFIRHCVVLLSKAQNETRNVNGVVLPEYAINLDVFNELCDALKKEEDALEFVVAGSSNNCLDKKANTVLTRVWQKRDQNKHLTNSRRKHHRWRLDRRQVEAYGLGTVLNPVIQNWWETTPIGQRELHFHRFRKDSVFSALICEELARSDACHDIVRAIGPNLIFALLMDSAQIPARWPGQYAAALADDPGCAVLSVTSYGLVERSNRTRKDGSRSIALWKDDNGNVVTIDMPPGEGPRGILLSLWSEMVKDQTIVGKRSSLRAWRYSSHVPILGG